MHSGLPKPLEVCKTVGKNPAQETRRNPAPCRDIMIRQGELAPIMTTEMGKPLGGARGEVVYAAEVFRWSSEEAVRIGGDLGTSGNGSTRILDRP